MDATDNSRPRTELDSHANMVVLGKNCFIFDNVHGRTCEVEPFDRTLGTAKHVPIVDAAISYDCPYTHHTTLLIVRNALYIPSMFNNLIPPFILREAGIKVKDIPKIHVDDPDETDHSLYFPDDNIRIPLQLCGIFSFFHTRSPTLDEISHSEPIFLTPDSNNWNPYSDHFATNEESMIDWEGNMKSKKFRTPHTLDWTSSFTQDDYDSAINSAIASSFLANNETTTTSSFIDDYYHDFASALNSRTEISKFSMSIGSTTARPDNTFGSFQPTYSHIDDFVYEIDSTNASKPHTVSSDFLSKIWNIKPDLAKKTLNQTTQLYRKGADNSLSRRYSTNDRMLRYKRINSQFFTDTFFVTSTGKSTRGNSCAQLFVSDKGFVAIYPMESKRQFKDALHRFCKDVGVPATLLVDPSGEQTSKKVRKFCHQVGTTLKVLEESTQWANRAELYIGLFKESIRQDLSKTNSPMKLWDYCAERRTRIHNVTPRDLFQLNGNTPITATFGTQPDISNICQFDWYDWCYFREESQVQFPFQKRQLGRVLGPLQNEGNEMSQAVLTITGKVVPRHTCSRLSISELHSPSEIQKRNNFDKNITELLGDSVSLPAVPEKTLDLDIVDLIDDTVDDPLLLLEEDPIDSDGTSVYEKPITDLLIHAEVLLPQGDTMQQAKVIQRSKSPSGDTVGTYDSNPLLNSILYDVEFPDGAIKEYSANIIAENMYSQIDSDGYSNTLLDSIIDYRSDGNAITKENKYVMTKSGQRRLRKTTEGWKLLVLFKDGSEQWIPLKILKETNPLDVAEFAKSKGLTDEAAFDWWVPFTLRQRDRIIAAVNTRVRRTSHKYGIEVPFTLDQAKKLDHINGNNLWEQAINLEMANVKVAFEILDTDQAIPVGWTKSSGHLVFDVKMDFTRKARWVKDGHRTPTPAESTYAGVVSRESVRICLTYAALNGLDVQAADIKNAYLQAPSSEKHYIICGGEFGLENVGKVALIRRALYGGKSSGADFWKHLRTCMNHLGFKSCEADPDIWMRKAQKDDGSIYWEYVLLYVDDALCISMDPETVLKHQIGKYFFIKPSSVGPPKIYLGNKVSKVTLDNGAQAWAFSSSQYVQNAVNNVEQYLSKHNKSLPKKATSPLSNYYRPEIDVTPELNATDTSYYQSLIGIIRWIVELGRIDITCEASLMASCMALPREGHLQQLFHIFAYLKSHHNTQMVFDPSDPPIESTHFEKQDWQHTVYGQCSEELPANANEPRGFGFKIRAYVDSDHAGDSITRRSRTGFIVFLNSSPIYWTSKKQTSIEKFLRE
jgi:hypothetical protein